MVSHTVHVYKTTVGHIGFVDMFYRVRHACLAAIQTVVDAASIQTTDSPVQTIIVGEESEILLLLLLLLLFMSLLKPQTYLLKFG